jgi:hypothetical protein
MVRLALARQHVVDRTCRCLITPQASQSSYERRSCSWRSQPASHQLRDDVGPRLVGKALGLAWKRTPFASALVLPSLVLLRMRKRSYSARPPSTVSISLPAGVVVSAQASPRLRNVAPALPIASSVFKRSRVERASRSSLDTTSVSPSPNAAMAFAS